MSDACFACLYAPADPCGDRSNGLPAGGGWSANAADAPLNDTSALVRVAADFSPRYERHTADLIAIDVSGLDRLLGPPDAVASELRRTAGRAGRVHIAVAGTWTSAMVLALARPGVTVVDPGGEARAVALLPITVLQALATRTDAHAAFPAAATASARHRNVKHENGSSEPPDLTAFKRWGLRTLGELAALPPADLAARLGRPARQWQALARGEDIRPLIPTLPEERFESTMELEWPIEGLEPLSFVLTRLLEPLAVRLERHDRGAAVLHVVLRLVTRDTHARRLQLPSPMRDVRPLRTLALLDLESHPPDAAIDRVTVVVDPTPGRILQHTLFTRPHPTPEQLSTLLARLGALMGQDRLGAPATIDSYRPDGFAVKPFATEHAYTQADARRSPTADADLTSGRDLIAALRRCRQPVPARVAVDQGRPARVTTNRRGFGGGNVVACTGPWRTSGEWWSDGPSSRPSPARWNRDEWDVVLGDGAAYRIFQDRETEGWFIDAIVD
jgi:protein ImuB